MTKNLDFSALVPQRDTFTDQEGQTYDFKSLADFGVIDMASIKRLQREMQTALDALAANAEDETAARNFEALADRQLKLVLPALPDDRLKAMTLGQKAKIVEWWGAQNKIGPNASQAGGNGVGEAPADQTRATPS